MAKIAPVIETQFLIEEGNFITLLINDLINHFWYCKNVKNE
jgi:hypothetical protein